MTNDCTADILKKLSRLTTKQRTLITKQWKTLKDFENNSRTLQKWSNLKTVNSDSVWMKSQFNWTGYSKDDGSPLKNGMCSHLKSATRMGSHREVIFFENNFRTWEFDPGSGWTLAACLTHASRTKHSIWFSSEMKILWLSGGRVSNAWVTCLIQGDNSWKRLLIPHKRTVSHGTVWKTPVVWDGPASD